MNEASQVLDSDSSTLLLSKLLQKYDMRLKIKRSLWMSTQHMAEKEGKEGDDTQKDKDDWVILIFLK